MWCLFVCGCVTSRMCVVIFFVERCTHVLCKFVNIIENRAPNIYFWFIFICGNNPSGKFQMACLTTSWVLIFGFVLRVCRCDVAYCRVWRFRSKLNTFFFVKWILLQYLGNKKSDIPTSHVATIVYTLSFSAWLILYLSVSSMMA